MIMWCEKCNEDFRYCACAGETDTSSQATGSLPAKWRRLADSWIKATSGMDDFDDCRVRAVARANAYRDCADELEANVTHEPCDKRL